MDNEKILKILNMYLLTVNLKEKLRSGWVIWNIDAKRIESIAEHTFGLCMLAIGIYSEIDYELDLNKVILMCVLHDIEEAIIDDITPFDKITRNEKRTMGKQAIYKILGDLTKKEEYIDIIEEYENQQTVEARFVKMCDKLEADIQSKIYCQKGYIDLNNKANEKLLKNKTVKKLINEGAETIADLFIEFDRQTLKQDESFISILDYIKNNDILNKE